MIPNLCRVFKQFARVHNGMRTANRAEVLATTSSVEELKSCHNRLKINGGSEWGGEPTDP